MIFGAGSGISASVAFSTSRGADIFGNFLAVDGSGQTMDPQGPHWLATVNKAF